MQGLNSCRNLLAAGAVSQKIPLKSSLVLLLSLFPLPQTFSPTNSIIWLYHYIGSNISFSLFSTPGFFFPPLSISCCCFICLNFDEFLSHPQDSQTLFCFVYFLFFAQCWQHFFEPYKSFRCCFLIPCLCPAVGCQETNPLFWGGGKLQFHHFLPKIILPHFFCPDLSRHFKLLR